MDVAKNENTKKYKDIKCYYQYILHTIYMLKGGFANNEWIDVESPPKKTGIPPVSS